MLLVGGGRVVDVAPEPAAPANATPHGGDRDRGAHRQAAPPPRRLPPLDQMDAFLRPLLAALSSRPELAQLAGDRRPGAAARRGDRPGLGRRQAGARVQGDRAVSAVRRRRDAAGGAPSIRPAIAATTGWCGTVTSIDASRSRKIYKTIRPRLNEAYRTWAIPTATSTARVQQTLDILLDTPVVKDPIARRRRRRRRLGLRRSDDLEALAPTQKQLLRMGPANVDGLLVWLRALQSALD